MLYTYRTSPPKAKIASCERSPYYCRRAHSCTTENIRFLCLVFQVMSDTSIVRIVIITVPRLCSFSKHPLSGFQVVTTIFGLRPAESLCTAAAITPLCFNTKNHVRTAHRPATVFCIYLLFPIQLCVYVSIDWK